jgi:hypothetical protein
VASGGLPRFPQRPGFVRPLFAGFAFLLALPIVDQDEPVNLSRRTSELVKGELGRERGHGEAKATSRDRSRVASRGIASTTMLGSGGPSVTARAVALARSRLERPRIAGGDPEAELRLYAGLRATWLWPAAVLLMGWMAARTRFFDEMTLKAIERGIRQVVIVGAGYDGRALRFRQPGLRFFEVDQASTQVDKRQRVDQLGLGFRPIDYVACDLTRDDLVGALAAAGYVAEQPALFVCEGPFRLRGPAALPGSAGRRDRAACAALVRRAEQPAGPERTRASGGGRSHGEAAHRGAAAPVGGYRRAAPLVLRTRRDDVSS